MDLGDDILNGIVATIASKNNVLDWNANRIRNGQILIKIRYGGDKIEIMEDNASNSEFNPERSSYKKLSVKQCKRNFHRARQFRDNSFEIQRAENEMPYSTPAPSQLDVSTCEESVCLSENPVSHKELPVYDSEAKCEAADETNQPSKTTLDRTSLIDKINRSYQNAKNAKIAKNVKTVPSLKPIPKPRIRTSKEHKRPMQPDLPNDQKVTSRSSVPEHKECILLGPNAWCNIGNVPTNCSCTNVYECEYCTDFRVDKMCKRCQDSHYFSGT